MTVMDEQKKDAALEEEKKLDEETLENVAGGGYSAWVEQAWDKILGKGGSGDNKEQQP